MNIYLLAHNWNGQTMEAYFAEENALRAVRRAEEKFVASFPKDESWDHKTYHDPETGHRFIYVCSEGGHKGSHVVFKITPLAVKDNPLEALAAQAE